MSGLYVFDGLNDKYIETSDKMLATSNLNELENFCNKKINELRAGNSHEEKKLKKIDFIFSYDIELLEIARLKLKTEIKAEEILKNIYIDIKDVLK
jgi:hypothetical protein